MSHWVGLLGPTDGAALLALSYAVCEVGSGRTVTQSGSNSVVAIQPSSFGNPGAGPPGAARVLAGGLWC